VGIEKKIGTISVTARAPLIATVQAPPTVAVDAGEPVEVPWGETVTFEVEHGEHDVYVNRGLMYEDETCCWVDDEGVRLEWRLPRTRLGSPGLHYLD
jgi:hypothetical protein